MLYLKLFLSKQHEDKRYGTNIENKILPFSAPYSTKIHQTTRSLNGHWTNPEDSPIQR